MHAKPPLCQMQLATGHPLSLPLPLMVDNNSPTPLLVTRLQLLVTWQALRLHSLQLSCWLPALLTT